MVNEDSLEVLELEIAMMVRALRTRTVELDKNQEFKRAGYLILLLISREGPMSVKNISDKLHLDISTVSRQAADLMKDEMLQKKQSETDRRSYIYDISVKGSDMITHMRQGRKQRFVKMLDEWEDEDIEDFARLLQKFNNLMN